MATKIDSVSMTEQGVEEVPVVSQISPKKWKTEPQLLDIFQPDVSKLCKAHIWTVCAVYLVNFALFVHIVMQRFGVPTLSLATERVNAGTGSKAISILVTLIDIVIAPLFTYNFTKNAILRRQKNLFFVYWVHTCVNSILCAIASYIVGQKMTSYTLGFMLLFILMAHHMKMHSYVDMNFDAMKRDSQSHALAAASVNPKHFLYFLAAPTLVYDVSFPRHETRMSMRRVLIHLVLTFVLLTNCRWLLKYELFPAIAKLKSHGILIGYLHVLLRGYLIAIQTFFAVFVAFLGLTAEITRFADCRFYRDWWNSTEYSYFSRAWNSPVHEWLMFHVYFKIPFHKMRNTLYGRIYTYTISSVLHEVFLYVLLGYLPPLLWPMAYLQLLLNFNKIPSIDSRARNLLFHATLSSGFAILLCYYGYMAV